MAMLSTSLITLNVRQCILVAIVLNMQGILRQRTSDVDVKKYCIEHIRQLGGFEHTREELKQLEER